MEQLELEEYIDRVEAEQQETKDRVRGSGMFFTGIDWAAQVGPGGIGGPQIGVEGTISIISASGCIVGI